MAVFSLVSPYPPRGDQPQAIEKLARGLEEGALHQTLLGVTGSGKTFTMANVIARWGRPTLVISHNKTLAAQLASEFREFFPHNAVEYFVSYYDYYQPEAYIPSSDTYIEKDSSINDEIDRLRHSATQAVLERRDVIIVASVSCIYGLGSPQDYMAMTLTMHKGEELTRSHILERLVEMHFTRNPMTLNRGEFRMRGEVLEVLPADDEEALRVTFWGDEIEEIVRFNPLTGETTRAPEKVVIYPAKHFVTPWERLEKACHAIEHELEEQVRFFTSRGKPLEAERIEMRTRYDLELLRELGYCQGVENYSRFLTGRSEGEPPFTLIDYFPQEFLVIIDESHVTIPQLRGMHRGDRSRKETLITHGFRLPSAFDNRPLTFEEFQRKTGQVVYVSATPAPYELSVSSAVVEQIIRPTGLVDPEVILKPAKDQVLDLISEVRARVSNNERVLVTTLTKKMAEDLAEHMAEQDIKVRYLHSEIDTLERIAILRDLRLGIFDCLVGVNLLREGLDLPEVSLVAVLDADKEGFLRSEVSLIQTIGRAARNISGTVILYADDYTDSMDRAVGETRRRRAIQLSYNEEHHIIPETIRKAVRDILEGLAVAEAKPSYARTGEKGTLGYEDLELLVRDLEKLMRTAAKSLEFEKAAAYRDEMLTVKHELTLRKESALIGPAAVPGAALKGKRKRRGSL
ncbi:MAG: excinuclease ABC subunit UvrB [Candidatus Eremiobacteraeota bacterium]|nr:excinuclease ABC subunit UvrB [Candidatus Eremiobacteraeota bacterium]